MIPALAGFSVVITTPPLPVVTSLLRPGPVSLTLTPFTPLPSATTLIVILCAFPLPISILGPAARVRQITGFGGAGGFSGARAVAAVAAARYMACDVNGSLESAIGNAANLHFALANVAVSMASVIPISAPAGQHPYRIAGRYYEDDVIKAPFPVRDGALLPLDRPGLGIDVDEARLARYRSA